MVWFQNMSGKGLENSTFSSGCIYSQMGHLFIYSLIFLIFSMCTMCKTVKINTNIFNAWSQTTKQSKAKMGGSDYREMRDAVSSWWDAIWSSKHGP